MNKFLSSVLAAAILFFGFIAYAQMNIHPMKADGVEYVTGGIGLDERQEMEKSAKDYTVKAVFAVSSGGYAANVMVTITKPSGEKVLEVTSDPWLYAKLPPGKYSLKAVYKGKEETKTIEIGKELKSVLFTWKA